jgi:hypothetical protein
MHVFASAFAASALSLCAMVIASPPDISTFTASAQSATATPSSKCQDNDNGNTFKRGKTSVTSVVGKKTVYEDVCVDATSVKEHLCVGVTYHVNTMSCANGCKNGACLKKSLAKCQDGDKGNTFRRGKTSVTSLEGKKTVYEDVCTSGTGLTEHSCSGLNYSAKNVSCANGCKNGACLKKTLAKCQDNDGTNTFKRGKTAVTNIEGKKTTYTDECVGEMQVREHSCSNATSYVVATASCEFGCINGACLKKPIR